MFEYLSLFFFVSFLSQQVNGQCWIPSYGRGVGKVLNSCPNGYEQNGALCYPNCKSGFTGVGPVCWSICPNGTTDNGATCWKTTDTYGKGCCCTLFTKDCCHNCKDGYTDIGCLCGKGGPSIKDSYGRGAGIPMICRSDQEQDAGLCYPYCDPGFKGVGPVCWGNSCSGDFPYLCGALCVTDQTSCTDITKAIVKDTFTLLLDIGGMIFTSGAGNWIGLISDAAGLSVDLLNDKCTTPNHAPTQCWKSFGKGAFTCNETQNPVDCGFFCASSPVHCAKTTFGIINVMTSMASSFVKFPAKAAMAVGKTQQELNAFTQKFSFTKLISVLKEVNGYPNSFTKSNSVDNVDYFVSNVKEFFDATNGIQTERFCNSAKPIGK